MIACLSYFLSLFVSSQGRIGRGFLHVCRRPLFLQGRKNEGLDWIKRCHALREPGYGWWKSREVVVGQEMGLGLLRK